MKRSPESVVQKRRIQNNKKNKTTINIHFFFYLAGMYFVSYGNMKSIPTSVFFIGRRLDTNYSSKKYVRSSTRLISPS